MKRFLDNVVHDNGRYLFQDVPLKQFEIAKESVAKQKDAWLNLVSEAISMRLENDESVASKYATTILNTDGWIRHTNDDAFADEALEELFNFYEQPLKNAGFQGGLSDLLDQWHSVVEYTTKYLNIKSDYKEVWHQIFGSSKRGEWDLVLLLVELLFCLPVSNAKVERLFSLMNRVKTDGRCSLKEGRLNDLRRICMEGPDIENFDAIPAMKLWCDGGKVRRPNQSARKTYKQRPRKDGAVTLTDMVESSDDEDIVQELEELD